MKMEQVVCELVDAAVKVLTADAYCGHHCGELASDAAAFLKGMWERELVSVPPPTNVPAVQPDPKQYEYDEHERARVSPLSPRSPTRAEPRDMFSEEANPPPPPRELRVKSIGPDAPADQGEGQLITGGGRGQEGLPPVRPMLTGCAGSFAPTRQPPQPQPQPQPQPRQAAAPPITGVNPWRRHMEEQQQHVDDEGR